MLAVNGERMQYIPVKVALCKEPASAKPRRTIQSFKLIVVGDYIRLAIVHNRSEVAAKVNESSVKPGP